MTTPTNFEASQLQQEGFVWSNLLMNLITWVLTMTQTKKMFKNFNSVCVPVWPWIGSRKKNRRSKQ